MCFCHSLNRFKLQQMPHWSYTCGQFVPFGVPKCFHEYASVYVKNREIPSQHVVPYEEFNMYKILFQYCRFFLYIRIILPSFSAGHFGKKIWKKLAFSDEKSGVSFCCNVSLWIDIFKFYHLKVIFCEYCSFGRIIAIYLWQERSRIVFSQLIKIPQWCI